jgi:hypothetical protein
MAKISKRSAAILSGIGSVFAIMPATNYAQFVPSANPQERMRSHWEDTGKHMRKALTQYNNEQKQR